jgi:hypothetical protein
MVQANNDPTSATWSVQRVHHGAVCGATAAALGLVLLGGELAWPAWLTLLAPLWSLHLGLQQRALPAAFSWVAIIVGIALSAQTLVAGGIDNAVFGAGMLLMALLCGRLLTRTSLDHDLQVIVLCLMLVIAGTVLNVGMSYFVALVLFAIASIWALSTRQLLAGLHGHAAAAQTPRHHSEDNVDRSFFVGSLVVSLVVLLCSVGLFVVFPRVGFAELSGFFQRSQSKLSTSVRLGGLPFALGGGNRVVARISDVPDQAFEDGLYLRALTYDVLDGSSFRQSEPALPDAPVEKQSLPLSAGTTPVGPTGLPSKSYRVQLAPLAADVAVTLGSMVSLQVDHGGQSNANRSLMYAGVDGHDSVRLSAVIAGLVTYDVVGTIARAGEVSAPGPRVGLSKADRARYLLVNSDDKEFYRTTASNIAGGPLADVLPADVVKRLVDGLLQFRYSAEANGLLGQNVQTFLTDTKSGNCELFATSLALLLRAWGIPARVVGGFQGGALDEAARSVVFQERHAHAWVEWFDEGVGWRTEDATPLATASRETLSGFSQWLETWRRRWADRVLDYELTDQQSAFDVLRGALKGLHLKKILAGLCALAALTAALWRLKQWSRQRSQQQQQHRLHNALAHTCAALGAPMQSHDTWVEAATRATLAPSTAHARGVVMNAAWMLDGLRFGGAAPSVSEVDRMLLQLQQVSPLSSSTSRRHSAS